MYTKINQIEIHNGIVVCNGQFILIELRHLLPETNEIGIHDENRTLKLFSDFEDKTGYNLIQPVVVSMCEEIEAGDSWISINHIEFSKGKGIQIATKEDVEFIKLSNNNKKVIVFPENFSLGHLQSVIKDILKDEHKVFVECDTLSNEPSLIYKIKLTDNHSNVINIKSPQIMGL